jgi:hypothetical protein
MAELDGTIPSGKDGITVSLIDQTGKTIKTTRTVLGGYYLFTLPAPQARNVKIIIS